MTAASVVSNRPARFDAAFWSASARPCGIGMPEAGGQILIFAGGGVNPLVPFTLQTTHDYRAVESCIFSYSPQRPPPRVSLFYSRYDVRIIVGKFVQHLTRA